MEGGREEGILIIDKLKTKGYHAKEKYLLYWPVSQNSKQLVTSLSSDLKNGEKKVPQFIYFLT